MFDLSVLHYNPPNTRPHEPLTTSKQDEKLSEQTKKALPVCPSLIPLIPDYMNLTNSKQDEKLSEQTKKALLDVQTE